MIREADWANIRQKGDPEADAWVQSILQQKDKNFLREILPLLSDYNPINNNKMPKILADIIVKKELKLTDQEQKQIARATDFYWQNEQNIDIVLGLYALPYCYLGANGARVLQLSKRIQTDTYKRLKETGAFVKAVMLYDHWQSGYVYQVIRKVRLLHAIIRHFTQQTATWQATEWGIAINQEDMLGTNIAFSFIVLKGLEKMSIRVASEYEKSYLFIWEKIGSVIGIEPQYLPKTYQQHRTADKIIAKRQFQESDQGKELAQALLQVVRTQAGSTIIADLLQEQMRQFLGEDKAKMLGISETNTDKLLLKAYQLSTKISQIFK